MPMEIEDLRLEARYWQERYDLLRAKEYGGRVVAPTRMAALERAARGAAARLKRAETGQRDQATAGTTRGERDG